MFEVLNRNVLDWCKEYSGEKFHSLLCDPPYFLSSVAKRYGKEDSAPAKSNRLGGNDGFQGVNKGFMGKEWDNDIAFKPETWLALKEHLFDGAFLIAFASARGWHRMACAMEDAGLIMHPSIFGWCYGSGFPKATRIKNNEVFVGHRYGLQALKPALEPILVFQKPYSGKPVECITKTGAGALNIDGTRIGTETIFVQGGKQGGVAYGDWAKEVNTTHQGRWASNFVLSHTSECVDGNCPEYCPVRKLGEQSGDCGAFASVKSGQKGFGGVSYGKYKTKGDDGKTFYDEGKLGSASRFFFNSDFVLDKLENADAVIYQAKASKVERNMGCESLPMQKAGGMQGRNDGSFDGKITYNNNNHPTVKPLKLCEHLATLLLPPKEYAPRRLLVPFAGSGSEMIGAHLAGWEEIIGIELEKEYCNIAQARLKFWTAQIKLTQIETMVI